ncbi:MAG: ATP-grasp domain-containing protein [Clostridia bacterium]|nr:ATP-grasp domain-containing protein [Clostridia bacterium]
MKKLWLIYDDADFLINQGFARMMQERGKPLSLAVEAVLMSELVLGMQENGQPVCKRNGESARPDAILSRQRDAFVSEQFERMGIPVFNNSLVCRICNDKRITYQFLQGFPMPQTVFLSPTRQDPPEGTRFPVVVKPACSHGGDRVLVAHNEHEWHEAAARILPQPALQQAVVTEAGRDLRVYVLGGQILAGVMRTARTGVVSNFKQGGHVALHQLTDAERELAQRVIDRFEQAGAPLHMAGVDLLYDHGHPVLGEVEDVVGSRMLYNTSEIDIVALYLQHIAKILHAR